MMANDYLKTKIQRLNDKVDLKQEYIERVKKRKKFAKMVSCNILHSKPNVDESVSYMNPFQVNSFTNNSLLENADSIYPDQSVYGGRISSAMYDTAEEKHMSLSSLPNFHIPIKPPKKLIRKSKREVTENNADVWTAQKELNELLRLKNVKYCFDKKAEKRQDLLDAIRVILDKKKFMEDKEMDQLQGRDNMQMINE